MTKTVIADLDEIVFRLRNKDYGAYYLRKNYLKNTRTAFIAAIIFLFCVLVLPWGIAKILPEKVEEVEIEILPTEAVLKETKPIDEKKEEDREIIQKAPPPPPPRRASIRIVEPVLEKKEDIPEPEIPEDTVKVEEAIISTETQAGDSENAPDIPDFEGVEGGTGTEPVDIAAPEPPKDDFPGIDEYIPVDVQPEPLNFADIKKKVVYPEVLKSAGIEGKVYIKILVDKSGEVKKHKIIKSPHDLMSKEVEKVIPLIRFKPGIQANKPITCWVMIPFDFRLRNR